MKLPGVVLLLPFALLAVSPDGSVAGTWKVRFAGPWNSGPKTVGSIVLDLKVDGDTVTGTARVGSWPGEAPIAEGKIEGGHLTFDATGHLDSSTGIPTCHFEAAIDGDTMELTMTTIRNPGGPLGPGMAYKYKGKKTGEP